MNTLQWKKLHNQLILLSGIYENKAVPSFQFTQNLQIKRNSFITLRNLGIQIRRADRWMNRSWDLFSEDINNFYSCHCSSVVFELFQISTICTPQDYYETSTYINYIAPKKDQSSEINSVFRSFAEVNQKFKQEDFDFPIYQHWYEGKTNLFINIGSDSSGRKIWKTDNKHRAIGIKDIRKTKQNYIILDTCAKMLTDYKFPKEYYIQYIH